MFMKFRPSKRAFALPILLLCLSSCGFAQQPDPNKVRLMTYNIGWFHTGAAPERVANLRTILTEVNPQIVAMQEIEGRECLNLLFDKNWEVGIFDDPKEYQEQAIAVRKPLKLIKTERMFPGEAFDLGYPNGRDGLRAEIGLPNGKTVVAYVVHFKSRRGGRMQTDNQRQFAAALLAGMLLKDRTENSIVMGDINDAPDDISANILESGNVQAPPGAYKVEKPLMFNTVEDLYRKDYVSHGLARNYRGSALPPFVAGAFAENERTRGIDYKYPDDLKVTQIMFDQILIRDNMKPWFVKANVYSSEAALRGRSGKIKFNDDGTVSYLEEGYQASDHLPVFVDLDMSKEIK